VGCPAPLVPAEELEAVFARSEPDAVESLLDRPARASAGIWRVRAGGDSAVLKLLQNGHGGTRWPATEGEDDPWYWRREASAYDAGVAAALGDFRAPALRHLAERPDGSVALWLEDVPAAGPWTPERLGEVACRLAAATAPPDERWLSRDWFRSYVRLRAALAAPGGEDGAFLSTDAGEVLTRLDALPQVLCHFDFHPGNVLGGGDVAIDWAYCGIGAPGVDAAVLALDALFTAFVPVEHGQEVLAAVWDGYADGLRSRGLSVDEIEWAYLASGALRLSWIPGFLAQGLGTPEQQARFAALVPLLRRMAERARRL
jgi:hypothetical protein